jgi:aminoglycoside 3-N-acetyltransferase
LEREVISGSTIVDALRGLGVRDGDLLLTHSSYKAFGEDVDGGPAGVARELSQVGGTTGGSVVPVFNFGKMPFDPVTSASLTGAISEAFRHLPGVKRSLNPTHSFAAIGPAADELVAGHESAHPFGRGSPIWKLYERNAWILLLGVDHRANSTVHVAEELVGVPQVNRLRVARMDGRPDWFVRRPGCSEGYNKVQPGLMERGAVKEATVGKAKLMLMRSRDIVEVASKILRDDSAALLCDNPDCVRCEEGRYLIQHM